MKTKEEAMAMSPAPTATIKIDGWWNYPEPPSGEYVYGCAMVPAQWVIHVLSGKKAER